MDTYGNGQMFGEAFIAICKLHEKDFDEILDDLKRNPYEFLDGLCDSIGCHRDQKKIHIHIDVDLEKSV